MYQKVKAYVEEQHMLVQGDKVIVGVSGGADSICLLFMLLGMREEMELELIVVHVHHGIRGTGADADEAFVKTICEDKKVPFIVFHENVELYAKEHGFTVEEAGRVVRRNAFEKTMREYGGTKIALAHHEGDNVETVIWNLCRGTGLKGLGGIAPVNGVWIRPLLCLNRKEIESYLKNWGISYCTDETNLEDIYTRNKIRHHVIPYLEEHMNEKTQAHIAETARQMQKLAEYIEEETIRMKSICLSEASDEKRILNKETYERFPEALRPYVMQQVICDVCGYRKDIEAVHVRLIEELLKKQVGKSVDLPYGLAAKRCYEGIEFSPQKGNVVEIENEEEKQPKVQFRVIECEEAPDTFPQSHYTKWFDYDIISNTVKIRHRLPGDYITIDQNGNTQKIKQYFINEKIPQEKRDAIWLVADGQHILWIVGYRQNQMYQITKETKRILEIEFCEGEEQWQKQ